MVTAPLHSGGASEYVGFEARAGGEGGGDILSFMGVKVMRIFKVPKNIIRELYGKE